MGIRKQQGHRVYGDDVIEQIRIMSWNDGLGAQAIADAMGMNRDTVRNLMYEHAITNSCKVYKVPKFKGWDFAPHEERNPIW